MPIKLPVLETILLTGRYSLCKRRSNVLPMDLSTLYLWISETSWYVHKTAHRGCCALLILGLKGMKKRSSGCSHSKSDSHGSGELEEAELSDDCFSSGMDLFFLPCLIHIPRIQLCVFCLSYYLVRQRILRPRQLRGIHFSLVECDWILTDDFLNSFSWMLDGLYSNFVLVG